MSVPSPAEVQSLYSDPITVEEYLRTSYRPDRELVEHRLKEKPMATELHAFTQALLAL